MLELINEARSEYMRQESLYLDEGDGYAQEAPPLPYPSRAPPPQPPALAKYHIYNDPLEFADMDQIAISVSLRRTASPLLTPLSPCKCNVGKESKGGALHPRNFKRPGFESLGRYFHIFARRPRSYPALTRLYAKTWRNRFTIFLSFEE